MSSQNQAPGASSVTRFCKDHDISRAHFYNLFRAGRAPKTFKVGSRRLISDEAAAEWRRQQEAETAEDAA